MTRPVCHSCGNRAPSTYNAGEDCPVCGERLWETAEAQIDSKEQVDDIRDSLGSSWTRADAD
jgi:rRNA maturation endonuclease Nob1